MGKDTYPILNSVVLNSQAWCNKYSIDYRERHYTLSTFGV
jgi:hypothetical protein